MSSGPGGYFSFGLSQIGVTGGNFGAGSVSSGYSQTFTSAVSTGGSVSGGLTSTVAIGTGTLTSFTYSADGFAGGYGGFGGGSSSQYHENFNDTPSTSSQNDSDPTDSIDCSNHERAESYLDLLLDQAPSAFVSLAEFPTGGAATTAAGIAAGIYLGVTYVSAGIIYGVDRGAHFFGQHEGCF